ncbi:threonylcarbamoyl-AMP synthase [Salipaludibacillus sp. LMS25]|uniref:L-threonylcarbamoyladenylate synthase n=1 Tax=Salipaludibacillus sp. LMS25 TaxID=2924031 RepID=UPI0020D12020|nr:L-threonylcarbamoyladenylate synthase [Salipaludibacillus sp. LMS25]UTR16969.1 threonylcarbamoyl-AMP synthase [Salipaludibacillus sp. LMS25]
MSVDNLANHSQIVEAAHDLVLHHVVAFPTETVYGLGGDATSDVAIERIFEAKGRPADNPLIVHIAERAQLRDYVKEISPLADKLMSAFWPGPLTIVFKHNGHLSKRVTAGLPTVAVRMPDHPVALALIKAAGVPLAAPSANRSGRPSPTTAAHVYEDLNGKISGIIDGGATGVGLESTVITGTEGTVTILRPGGITKEDLEAVCGPVLTDPALKKEDDTPISPGMKYVHYAPNAPLTLVKGTDAFLHKTAEAANEKGLRVGLLVTEDYLLSTKVHKKVVMGSREDLTTIAQHLYEALRAFAEGEVDVIFSETFPEAGLGNAIMNRLKKAAGGRTITETGN